MSKVIMVTGASSGMGKDFALALLKKGHTVIGLARRVDKMQDIVAAGGHAIAMDITDEAQITNAVTPVMEAHGRVDVLINNAGYAVYGTVEEVPIDHARRQFEVNIFGLASLTQKIIIVDPKNWTGSYEPFREDYLPEKGFSDGQKTTTFSSLQSQSCIGSHQGDEDPAGNCD